jgi:hypothetical protein
MATIGQFMIGDHCPPLDAVGVTEFDDDEGGPFPTELVAVTVNVYAVPFVSPLIVADVAGGAPLTVVEG